jgi:hypothetical protein
MKGSKRPVSKMPDSGSENRVSSSSKMPDSSSIYSAPFITDSTRASLSCSRRHPPLPDPDPSRSHSSRCRCVVSAEGLRELRASQNSKNDTYRDYIRSSESEAACGATYQEAAAAAEWTPFPDTPLACFSTNTSQLPQRTPFTKQKVQ